MPKSKHRKKTPKRKPKLNKPIKQTVKKATLNDIAQDIIDLYGDYMMTEEYDNIPLTDDMIQVKNDVDHLISRIQSGADDIEEVAFTLDNYFMSMEEAAEERGFVMGYLYAITRAKDVVYDEEGAGYEDE